jgi:hypothetical protein
MQVLAGQAADSGRCQVIRIAEGNELAKAVGLEAEALLYTTIIEENVSRDTRDPVISQIL